MMLGVDSIADLPRWQTSAVGQTTWAALMMQDVMASLVVTGREGSSAAADAVEAASGPLWNRPHPGSCGYCILQRRGRGDLHNGYTRVCRDVVRQAG